MLDGRHHVTAEGLTRRLFLGWSGTALSRALPLATALGLNACGGGDSSTRADASTAELTVLNNPTAASVSIQSRQVQWVPGRSPSADNAWVYVADGTATGVLPNHLGPVFNVRRGTPCTITWHNTLADDAVMPGALASPPMNNPLAEDICGNVRLQSAVGVVTHMHGARVAGGSDGWPLQPLGYAGNPYGFNPTQPYTYPNAQRGTMLWYHDHAMDRTASHVYAGLAGVYFIRDAADDAVLSLIGGGAQELLGVVQDRILDGTQTRLDYSAGMPDTEALFRPEFLGDTIFVNGHPSPLLTLTRRTWRVRLLNGSQARTYALALCDPDAITARAGTVWYSDRMRLIGADGGLISRSVALGATDVLLLAPGQRRDVLVDLASLPTGVTTLRLVNLALIPHLDVDAQTPEGIYTTFEDTVLTPTSALYQSADQPVYDALDSTLAAVQKVSLEGLPVGGSAPATAALDTLLQSAATDDDFIWDGTALQPVDTATFGPNRLVLLMSNTEDHATDDPVNGIAGWSDVQIFELRAGGSDWQVPFAVDLSTASNPLPGAPAAAQGYTLARRSFFAQEVNPDVRDAKAYPALHEPTIVATAGTYERWYVANVGNSQPMAANPDVPPDMHPFHVHLVNFVVQRRWILESDSPGQFTELAPTDLSLDRTSRQDTVMIPSNQLLELLVHFPPGYTGDYVYHCHLLEHEDKCMMSTFSVRGAPA